MSVPEVPTSISPGTYLRLRRQAIGLSVEQVALALGTVPHIPAIDRAEWLKAIEADVQPVTLDASLALKRVIAFDWSVLVALCANRVGLTDWTPTICHACGITRHEEMFEPGVAYPEILARLVSYGAVFGETPRGAAPRWCDHPRGHVQ